MNASKYGHQLKIDKSKGGMMAFRCVCQECGHKMKYSTTQGNIRSLVLSKRPFTYVPTHEQNMAEMEVFKAKGKGKKSKANDPLSDEEREGRVRRAIQQCKEDEVRLDQGRT